MIPNYCEGCGGKHQNHDSEDLDLFIFGLVGDTSGCSVLCRHCLIEHQFKRVNAVGTGRIVVMAYDSPYARHFYSDMNWEITSYLVALEEKYTEEPKEFDA